MDKAEKIKAARRKLKEFQSQNKKPDAAQEENEEVPIKHQESPPATASFFDTITNDSNPINVSSGAQQFFTTPSAPSPFQEVPEMIQQTHFSDISMTLPSIPEQQINYFQQQQPPPPPPSQNDDKINDYQMQISQLKSEVEFHRMTATNLQKNVDELNRYRQQEQHQTEAIKLLVKEKTHLADAFQKSENIIATLKGETEELHNRLNLSRHRVKQLESSAGTGQPNIIPEIETRKIEELVEERMKDVKKSLEANESDKNELKILLHQKRIEMENLQRNYDHLSNELHLQSIKIAQLSDGVQPEGDHSAHQSHVAALTQDSAIKQQQMNELNQVIDQLNREKEASETQYQNYVSAMTAEMDLLKESSIELSSENNSLVKREQELLKHVSDLERQIQQQINKQKIYAENSTTGNVGVTAAIDSSHEVQKWTSQVEAISAENETLKKRLLQYESDKIEMNKKYEQTAEEMRSLHLQLERATTDTPNVSQLMVDFEDKSTAASRALIQNQSLKDQLEELQRAFVTISNDKMELTDKLQSELHLCKEMKTLYDTMDVELSAIKDKWQFKEDEMIRLSHSNTELEKKILQQNIEIDRLRHYESKDYDRGEGGLLENELENCRHLIESLTNKINVLESHNHEHNHDHHGHSHNHSPSPTKTSETPLPSTKILLDEIEMLKMEKNELLKAINDFRKSKIPEEVQPALVNGDAVEVEEMSDEKLRQMTTPPKPKSVTPSMATEEALEKLQERFRRTMLEVADLTEEKNRLEHVVTMLQFETETIGEYITLYQNQRRLLKQKEHQRDVELKNLAGDRELMNKKLLQLNGLIEKFVLQHTDRIEIAKEATKLFENEDQTLINYKDADFETLKKETAGKILEILSDIKTTNTRNYDSNIGVENSCSCCLGRLETV